MSGADNKVFAKEELKEYDGSNGVAFIAFEGKVYDVSNSFHWKKGIHHVTHHAGRDLTKAFSQAPHSTELLEEFPIVGMLVED